MAAVKEPRDEMPLATANLDCSKATRKFDNCEPCRNDSKKCVPVEGQYKCFRCIEKNRPCGPRRRKKQRPEYLDVPSEFLATSTAVLIALSAFSSQCDKLLSILFPFPIFTYGNGGAWGRSWTLGGAHEVWATRARSQKHLIEQVRSKVHVAMLSVWNRVAVSDLSHTVSFHPSRASEPDSSDNAGVIAWGVSYIPQACGLSIQQSPWNLATRIESYRKVESNFGDLLQLSYFSSPQSDPSLMLIQLGIPASTIAYLNGDKQAAFELWKHATSALDFLGRTLTHIVVEENDLGFLQQMASFDVRALDSGPDMRGFTPLAIATYAGCESCFDLMLWIHQRIQLEKYGIIFTPGDVEFSWLDLAFSSGSAHIVSQIVNIKYALPPYQRYFEIAIQMGRADLTIPMQQWLDRCTISGEELRTLQQMAENKAREMEEELELVNSKGQIWVARASSLTEWLPHMRALADNLRKLADALRSRLISNYIHSDRGQAIESLEELLPELRT